MELYRAEKVATFEEQPSKSCRFCYGKLKARQNRGRF